MESQTSSMMPPVSDSSIEVVEEDFQHPMERLSLPINSLSTIYGPPTTKNIEEITEFFKSRASTTEFCRICHDLDTTECFISPCNCKGSLSFVHKSCLERWLAESDSSKCEVCHYKFTVERQPKYSMMSSIITWLTSRGTWRERRHLLVDFITMILLTPVVFVTSLMALHTFEISVKENPYSIAFAQEDKASKRQVRGTQADETLTDEVALAAALSTVFSSVGKLGLIALVVTIDMAFVSWIALKLQYHVGNWYHWYRRSFKVILIGAEPMRRRVHGVDSASSLAIDVSGTLVNNPTPVTVEA